MNLKLLKKPSFLKSKFSINKILLHKILISLAVILMVGATFFYLFQSRDLKKTALGGILSNMIAERFETKQEVEEDVLLEKEVVDRNYEGEANYGEGLTHLARRALSEYIEIKEIKDLSAEHKIYVEDYIQKKLGGGNLSLGEKVTISYDLISEAVNNSRNLTETELNNLKQYSVLVSSL